MPTKSVTEFLGLDVVVRSSTNRSLTGLCGKVVAETMKTFSVRTKSGVKVVPKGNTVFEFKLGSGDAITVNGSDISKRPEERAWRYEAQ